MAKRQFLEAGELLREPEEFEAVAMRHASVLSAPVEGKRSEHIVDLLHESCTAGTQAQSGLVVAIAANHENHFKEAPVSRKRRN